MITLNFMPWRENQKRKNRLRILLFLLLEITLIFTLAFSINLYFSYRRGKANHSALLAHQKISSSPSNQTTKEHETNFSHLNALNIRMIGSLISHSKKLALIAQDDQTSSIVHIGDSIAHQAFKVTNITATEIMVKNESDHFIKISLGNNYAPKKA